MRIFVAYGYNDRDRGVEEYVFPLVDALGCEVLRQIAFGGTLPDVILRLIRTSDAMLGFSTRRTEVGNGSGIFQTHQWVVQELLMAHTQDPRIPG